MSHGTTWSSSIRLDRISATVGAAVLMMAIPAAAQTSTPSQVTFTKDIAPILQRSCQTCHRPDGAGPMSLVTYEEVRPWARAIKMRTGVGPRAGVMPPWYIEKNIGIQQYKDDPSLSEDEIAKIAKWVDNGAPRGNPADMPPALAWADDSVWRIGKPDLIVKLKDITVKANSPDWWGELENVPVGIDEDRYVSAIEIKEVNDIPNGANGRQTVGGHYVIHHLAWNTGVDPDSTGAPAADPAGAVPDSGGLQTWPVHEVGRNADYFDPRAARLLKAGSYVVPFSAHLHSNGRDTRAHVEIGFKLLPKGYKPEYRPGGLALGNGADLDIQPNQANQQLHAYAVLNQHMKLVTFEPHLHAPGMRMCMEAIWGFNIQTLACSGYDHNWVRGYAFQDDYAPLLPKGTILHLIGYMDTTSANKNVADPRNWQGAGNRSVANMFLDLGMKLALTDEQFEAEMAQRRKNLKLTGNSVVIGCPLCAVTGRTRPTATSDNQQQQ